MIKLLEFVARIIQFVKTLIYVFLTMLLLTAIFGYSHLSEFIMSIVFAGIGWCVGFLILEYAFGPGKDADGEKIESQVGSNATSSAKRISIVVFLGLWFLLLLIFSAQLLFNY